VVSGQFSKKACDEAKKYGDIVIAASSGGASPPYSTIPETKRADFRPDADYVHICYNNTIYGTKFHYIPDTGNIPLVADMTSCLCSEPIDVSKFGLIYAGAQVNIAPAGLTIVIIRNDLIGDAEQSTPAMLDYRLLSESESLYNTPPVYNIYMAKLTLEWMLSVGGLEEMKRRNERKASLLYDYLDGPQTFYTAPVDKKCRSMMNVTFVTGDGDLDKKFAIEAAEQGLLNLEGHPGIGGMCASIYNAMPYEGVEKLVAFMKDFAKNNPRI
jgi:phosphoserine aminotransferase